MPELLDDLRQILSVRPDRVVFIVGTGVSVGALRSPSRERSTWAGLLGDGLRRAHELGNIDAPTLDHYQRQLELSHDLALIGVADIVSSSLGAPDGGEFTRWLQETVGTFPDDIQDRAVLEGLVRHQRRGALLATTNYDHLLETCAALKPTTWRRPAQVERALRGAEPRVLHLHGEWEDPESIVLGTRSYVDVTRDAHAQTVLAALRTDRTFVFVGCGAGLRDPNLGAFLKWTGGVFARSQARHFRLCLANEVDALRREHPSEQRIFPLAYGDAHAELATFLDSLLPAREGTRAPPVSPPSTPVPVSTLPPAPSPPIVLSGTWEEELHALIASALSPDELRQWIFFHFRDLYSSLPPATHTSPTDHAFKVFELFTQRGHIHDEFFAKLGAKLGPHHAPRVAAIRDLRSSGARPLGAPAEPTQAPAASPATPRPAASSLPSKLIRVLDRIEQWSAIVEQCEEDPNHLAFVVHGTRRQNVALFASRIEQYLPIERVRRHSAPFLVDRRGGDSFAVLAGEWAARTIAATEHPHDSLEDALRFEIRRHAAAFIYLDRGAPLHDLGRDGESGLTTFLKSDLPKALAVAGKKNPIRIFFPVEDNRPLAEALHAALGTRVAKEQLKVHDILELTFPPWDEVEHFIHDQFGAVPGDVRAACKRCYDEADAAGHDLQTLGEGVTRILSQWFKEHG